MKIIIEEGKNGEEDCIIIRCKQLDEKLLQLIYGIKMQNENLIGVSDGKIYRLKPAEIYYIETVDNKGFIYCKEKVYETKLKLYEIEKEYVNTNFLRISKSVIVNLAKINYVSPAFNGRFEAVLNNGEKIMISRQYVFDFKKKLGL